VLPGSERFTPESDCTTCSLKNYNSDVNWLRDGVLCRVYHVLTCSCAPVSASGCRARRYSYSYCHSVRCMYCHGAWLAVVLGITTLVTVTVIIYAYPLSLLSLHQHSTNSTSSPGLPYQTIQYTQPTLCSPIGIGGGQRQLIAVTCIAEHA